MDQGDQVTSLWVGDLHLCERTYAGRETQIGDPQYAWEQVIERALELKKTSPAFTHVFLAGDVFNSKQPDPATVSMFRKGCAKLNKQDIVIGVIQGNHDWRPVPWATAICPYVKHLHQKTIKVGKLTVAGLDYLADELVDLALAAMEPADILLCHQRWAEFAFEGAMLSIKNIPWKCQVFSGDTHKRILLRKDLNNVSVAISPGATYMRKSDEPAEHFLFELTQEGRWLQYPLQSRRVLRQELQTDDEVDVFLDNLPEALNKLADSAKELPEQLRTPIVVIRPGKLGPKAKHRVMAALRGVAHLFWSTVAEDDDEEAVQEAAAGGSTAFLEAAQQRFKKKPITFGMLKRIWNSSNPREELNLMRKEKFGDAN